MSSSASVLFLLFLWGSAVQSFTISPILRPNRPNPSCNAYVVYDDSQVLVVDIGKEETDVDDLISVVTAATNSSKRLNAFITHGHPDHAMGTWKLKQAFPGIKVYVASEEIKNELVILMDVFAPYLNASSPGNPKGNAPDKFDYSQEITVMQSVYDLWSNPFELTVLVDDGRKAETNHFAWLEFTNTGASITGTFAFVGDLVYVKSHLFMGYDVNLDAQCDWVNVLKYLSLRYPLPGSNFTILYPGHGESVASMDVQNVLLGNINYILFARDVYTQNCDPKVASNIIMQKFPDFNELPLLVGFSAPVRVGDASILGCNCTASSTCPGNIAPKCL